MAKLTGSAGNVKISTNAVAEMTKWSLSYGPNLQDGAAFGDSWEEKDAGIRKWSGSFSGYAVDTDTNGQDALRTAALNGTSVSLRLYTGAATYYSGTAFIEISHEADESSATQAVSYSFTGSGALSYT